VIIIISPVAVAGLQRKEGVQRSREEAERHHGNCPQDGDGQGLLAVDNPHREERETVYRSTSETMPHGMAASWLPSPGEVTHSEAVEQDGGHGENAEQGDGFCNFH